MILLREGGQWSLDSRQQCKPPDEVRSQTKGLQNLHSMTSLYLGISNFEVIFKLWNLPKSLLLCDAVPTTELTNRKKK